MEHKPTWWWNLSEAKRSDLLEQLQALYDEADRIMRKRGDCEEYLAAWKAYWSFVGDHFPHDFPHDDLPSY